MNQYENFLIDVHEYKDKGQIGTKGRFGTISKVQKIESESKKGSTKENQFFVLRNFQSGIISDKDILREIEILSKLRYHPCICKFHGFSLAPFQILFEYIPNPSLQFIFDELSHGRSVSYWNGTVKSKTIFGITCAIYHMHVHDEFHRFLTPKCILYDKNYEPKLTDFFYIRQSELDDEIKMTRIGNDEFPSFVAPEIDDGKYDLKVDCFSLGMIFYQIVTGKPPFEGKSLQITEKIRNGTRPTIPDDCDARLKKIITDLWNNNPNKRPFLIDVIKALINYEKPMFPDTDMDEYREYRERIIESTYITEEDEAYLQSMPVKEEDRRFFEKTLKKAEEKDIESIRKIAKMFELGIGTSISLSDAIEYYQKAADLNDKESIYKIANFYLTENEVFIDVDEDLYIENLKKAADLNYNPAICDYAHILSIGSGVDQNIPLSISMLKKIADPPENDKVAQYRLSQIYDKIQKDDSLYIHYLEESYKQNFLPAKVDFATCLLEGKGSIAKDIDKGLKLLKQAVDEGSPMAASNLALIYQKAYYDQPQNLDEALRLHRIAEKEGSATSMVELGKAYFRGKFGTIDFEEDHIRAARLFERAAEKYDPEGLYSWAVFELNGYGGTAIDINSAVTDLKTAADMGFSQAMFKLYQLYNEGINGVKDVTTAIMYLNMACDRNNKNALSVRDSIGSTKSVKKDPS